MWDLIKEILVEVTMGGRPYLKVGVVTAGSRMTWLAALPVRVQLLRILSLRFLDLDQPVEQRYLHRVIPTSAFRILKREGKPANRKITTWHWHCNCKKKRRISSDKRSNGDDESKSYPSNSWAMRAKVLVLLCHQEEQEAEPEVDRQQRLPVGPQLLNPDLQLIGQPIMPATLTLHQLMSKQHRTNRIALRVPLRLVTWPKEILLELTMLYDDKTMPFLLIHRRLAIHRVPPAHIRIGGKAMQTDLGGDRARWLVLPCQVVISHSSNSKGSMGLQEWKTRTNV
jgi:hypothetical protein